MKTLIIGANGQIGTELTRKLREKYGLAQVITTDIRESRIDDPYFYQLDATDKEAIEKIIAEEGIEEVYLMAAILSAKAEQFPLRAWQINMNVVFNLLEIARSGKIRKLFWPSSIAVFGPHTPKKNTPQFTVTDPDTVYGISKLAGERWSEYYYEKYGVDVRSIRYPGIISWKTLPGGGTTDYAVEMFHYALRGEKYVCYIAPDERLPMMYIDDAIQATVDIMDAPAESIRIRSSYNLAAFSLTPQELAGGIKRYIPGFHVEFKPDYRQKIAATWPDSIDDTAARKDWNWKPLFNLDEMIRQMLVNLSEHQYPEIELTF